MLATVSIFLPRVFTLSSVDTRGAVRTMLRTLPWEILRSSDMPDWKADYGKRAKSLGHGEYTITATAYPGKKCCGRGTEETMYAKIYMKK